MSLTNHDGKFCLVSKFFGGFDDGKVDLAVWCRVGQGIDILGLGIIVDLVSQVITF